MNNCLKKKTLIGLLRFAGEYLNGRIGHSRGRGRGSSQLFSATDPKRKCDKSKRVCAARSKNRKFGVYLWVEVRLRFPDTCRALFLPSLTHSRYPPSSVWACVCVRRFVSHRKKMCFLKKIPKWKGNGLEGGWGGKRSLLATPHSAAALSVPLALAHTPWNAAAAAAAHTHTHQHFSIACRILTHERGFGNW